MTSLLAMWTLLCPSLLSRVKTCEPSAAVAARLSCWSQAFLSALPVWPVGSDMYPEGGQRGFSLLYFSQISLCVNSINEEFYLRIQIFFFLCECLWSVHSFHGIRVAARALAVHVALKCQLLLPCSLPVFNKDKYCVLLQTSRFPFLVTAV